MFGDFPSSMIIGSVKKWGVSLIGSLHSPKLMKANNFGVQNFWPEAFFRSPDGSPIIMVQYGKVPLKG